MYKPHPPFRLVAIGILLTLADLRINTFDVVPDWLGYALMTFGLGRLTVRNTRFNVAYPLACVVCLLTLVAVFVPFTLPGIPSSLSASVFQSSDNVFRVDWSLSATVFTVFGIVLNWLVCDGVRHFSTARGDARAAQSAVRRRDQYVVLSLLWLVGLVLTSGSPGIGFFMALGVGLCSFVLDIALVRLLWRVADAPSAEQMLSHLVAPVPVRTEGIGGHISVGRHDVSV